MMNDIVKTRKEKRAEKSMSEGERRRRMRGVYKAIAYLAFEMKDTVVAKKLELWEPYVRARNPISLGIKTACASLDAYADELELEVKLALLDASKSETK